MKVYGKVGFSSQQIGGVPENGWVVMAGERPAPEMVASESGDWVAATPPVPRLVSRYQGRQALRLSTVEGGEIVINDTSDTSAIKRDLLEAVEELLAKSETPAYYRDAWADIQQFERDSAMLAALADELGLEAVHLDDLFRLAATLKA
ncbi:hypothetical protein [Achromobacter sp. DH1f]|uniref:hypothetical protein n=1 Tax=Achromobacter sp. DH1f TaxID=1397275 RepID=UPI000469D59E|nr:hypothetical protein [Achromobacter sp. DH1f]